MEDLYVTSFIVEMHPLVMNSKTHKKKKLHIKV